MNRADRRRTVRASESKFLATLPLNKTEIGHFTNAIKSTNGNLYIMRYVKTKAPRHEIFHSAKPRLSKCFNNRGLLLYHIGSRKNLQDQARLWKEKEIMDDNGRIAEKYKPCVNKLIESHNAWHWLLNNQDVTNVLNTEKDNNVSESTFHSYRLFKTRKRRYYLDHRPDWSDEKQHELNEQAQRQYEKTQQIIREINKKPTKTIPLSEIKRIREKYKRRKKVSFELENLDLNCYKGYDKL